MERRRSAGVGRPLQVFSIELVVIIEIGAAGRLRTSLTIGVRTSRVIAEDKNLRLLPEWLSSIESHEARAAFCLLIGIAACSDRYICKAQWKGEIRDFRFLEIASGEQPYSCIVNQQWLLFYFRRPALRSDTISREDLRKRFDSLLENSSGELTVKLREISDIQRLCEVIPWWLSAADAGQRSTTIGASDSSSLTTTFQSGSTNTTQIGYVNQNNQQNLGHRNLPGNDHLQMAYKMKCLTCGLLYGANGTDIFQRRCPDCQHGAAGIPY